MRWRDAPKSAIERRSSVFQRAVNLDPTYGPAYLGLADGFGLLSDYGIFPPAEARPRVEAAIERAAALGADPAELHRVRAFFHWQFLPADWEAALDEYDRALAIASGSAAIWQWSGVCLGALGRPEPAAQRLQRAFELDPLSLLIPCIYGGVVHYFSHQFEAAAPYFRQVLSVDPEFVPALWWLADTLTETGGHEEALALYEQALRLSDRMSRILGYYGYACGRAGRGERARELLADSRSGLGRSMYPPTSGFGLRWTGRGPSRA